MRTITATHERRECDLRYSIPLFDCSNNPGRSPWQQMRNSPNVCQHDHTFSGIGSIRRRAIGWLAHDRHRRLRPASTRRVSGAIGRVGEQNCLCISAFFPVASWHRRRVAVQPGQIVKSVRPVRTHLSMSRLQRDDTVAQVLSGNLCQITRLIARKQTLDCQKYVTCECCRPIGHGAAAGRVNLVCCDVGGR